MKKAVQIVATSLGIYAALLGIEHGVNETLQGNKAIGGMMFNAIGQPCVPDEMWHACQPAMSLLPNFLSAGILSVLVGAGMLAWSLLFIKRKHGGKVMIGLSVLLLLAGGGFIPPMIGVMAGIIGINIHTPLDWWRARLSDNLQSKLVKFWPRTLNFYFMWVLLQWVMGDTINDFLLEQGLLISFISNALLLLMVFSAVAYDLKQQDAALEPVVELAADVNS
jgi:hypothetical protein